jgi:very-short-patch-repair endonuclease
MRKTKNYKSLPYNSALRQRAKELRKAGNLSEALLWNQIKNRKLLGLDFDRQKVIGNYIVDFFSAQIGVIIEIDGYSHDFKVDYDERRNKFLESLGLEVIHVLDIDVKKNLEGVIEMLKQHPLFVVENDFSVGTTTDEK